MHVWGLPTKCFFGRKKSLKKPWEVENYQKLNPLQRSFRSWRVHGILGDDRLCDHNFMRKIKIDSFWRYARDIQEWTLEYVGLRKLYVIKLRISTSPVAHEGWGYAPAAGTWRSTKVDFLRTRERSGFIRIKRSFFQTIAPRRSSDFQKKVQTYNNGCVSPSW